MRIGFDEQLTSGDGICVHGSSRLASPRPPRPCARPPAGGWASVGRGVPGHRLHERCPGQSEGEGW